MVIVYDVGGYKVWVGVDQFENEDLIKFSQKYMERCGDILLWYHADKFSSPHAYIQLKEGETQPNPTLARVCCQICKDGSIKGSKEAAIDVVYTKASNLMKTKAMNPGQVSFHRPTECSYIRGVRKNAQDLKKLEAVRSETTIAELEVELDGIVKQKRLKQQANDAKAVYKEAVIENISLRSSMLEGMTQADSDVIDEDNFM